MYVLCPTHDFLVVCFVVVCKLLKWISVCWSHYLFLVFAWPLSTVKTHMIFFLAKIQTMECVESGNEVWFRVMLWIVCLGRKCYCFVHLILYTIIETHQILVDWLVLFMCKSMSKLAPWAGLCRDRGPCPLKLKYIYIYILREKISNYI